MKRFKILQRDGKARLGKLETAHGVIDTPNFIPVGTQASVKALSPRDLKEIGSQVVLANTYHLMLRPGVDVISKLDGLHKFMGWDGPIMTDSGGFQVLSLGIGLQHGVGKFLTDEYSEPKPRLNKVTEERVIFQSHIDGSTHTLDAEKSIDLQLELGADLIVVFDDLESPKYCYEETSNSLERSKRWELRSLDRYRQKSHGRIKNVQPLLYGVTHGGIFKDLRVKSAKFVDQHFAGIALGGAHKDKKTLYQVVDWTLANVSEEKPRHLLGIGEVVDLFEAVERGVDLFDCAAPTRRARHGSLYTSSALKNDFTIDIKGLKFKKDKNPVDPKCLCYTCQNFTRAYLRHLYTAGEIVYHSLASLHNVYFIIDLVRQIRQSIQVNQFKKLKNSWLF